MQDVPCTYLCNGHGEYTTIELDGDKQPHLACKQCPSDSIAIKGGLIYDSKME
jgi:hypothetical protein